VPLIDQILAPTNITNSGVAFDPHIASLSNGGYAVTYNDGADVVWTVFDAQGDPVVGGGVPQGIVELWPAIARVSGGFALAWEDFLDSDIYTAVFDEQGQPVAAPVAVSADPDSDTFPLVTTLSTGGYAVTWQNGAPGNSDIYTAAYDALGVLQGTGPVNVTDSLTIDDQFGAIGLRSVAALSGGGYAMVWASGTPGVEYDIFTAVYGDDGQELVAPVNVSQNPGQADNAPQIAALSTGGYALTWHRNAVGGGFETLTAVYDALGNEVAAPAPVALGDGSPPRIAALADGNYALFWSNGADVLTAVYDDQGQQVSAPVNVSNGLGADSPSDITVLSNGAYALTWTSNFAGVGSVDSDLFTAVFTAQGQQAVAPINVSDSAGVNESSAQLAALANGAYALSWESAPVGGSTDVLTAVYQFLDVPLSHRASAARSLSRTRL
jgi:hypothetical protein